MFNFEVKLAR